jgi:hypothetical protein
MTTIYIATGDALAIVRQQNGRWRASLSLRDMPTQCVAADERRPHLVYCGTFGRGLWCSQDTGEGSTSTLTGPMATGEKTSVGSWSSTCRQPAMESVTKP